MGSQLKGPADRSSDTSRVIITVNLQRAVIYGCQRTHSLHSSTREELQAPTYPSEESPEVPRGTGRGPAQALRWALPSLLAPGRPPPRRADTQPGAGRGGKPGMFCPSISAAAPRGPAGWGPRQTTLPRAR